MEHFKLIITIVDRGKGTKAVDLYRSHHLHFDFACLGAGTASSKILNYFGLDETAKELVWTLAPASRIPPLLPEVHRVLDLSTPGRGILFTIPLSGISAQIPQVLLKPEYEKEEPAMEEAKKTGHPYQLVLTIVNRGSPSTLGSPVLAKFTKAPHMTRSSSSQPGWWQMGMSCALWKK